jgi:hypothetical protein
MRIANRAFRFVLTIGIVSLFADMTYEGARGITGPSSVHWARARPRFVSLSALPSSSVTVFARCPATSRIELTSTGRSFLWDTPQICWLFLRLIVLSVLLQLAALPVFVLAKRSSNGR